MPTYEYQCAKCGHEFERDQRITDPPVTKCPSCRAARVKRLISATSFVLKGGGWYSDLYSSGKGKTDSAPAGESAESKSQGTAETASKDGAAKPAAAETKPAPKKPGRGPSKSQKTAAA